MLGFFFGCAPRTDSVSEQGPSSAPTVTAEDLQRTPGEPIEIVLMNKFPGVLVIRGPEGNLEIRIRGTTSLYHAEPLYVIDGVPIRAGPGGSLVGINPYDIESIEVLKDAAATTMYGLRGANGVIVVKTKVPARPPPPERTGH